MANVCKNCGAALEEGATVCTACGTAAEADTGYLGGKDPLTMALLAGLLGTIGLPYWMFGETKKAIIRLVAVLIGSWITCGILPIAVLVLDIIDAVKIHKGEYVIDPDKFI